LHLNHFRYPRLITFNHGSSELWCPLQDFHDTPSFGLGYRSALDDLYQVAVAAPVFLIMRMNLGRTLDVLSIQRVLNLPLNFYGHSLVSFVADNAPDFAALQGFSGAHAAVPSLDF
jgi:hypothetical protein